MDSTIGRRDFVKLAGGATLALGVEQPPALALGVWASPGGLGFAATPPGPDAAERDLVLLALDAARSAGASYADARIMRGNTESLSTRERQITEVSKTETYGIGVRALVGGSWGFAATRDLTKDAVARTAREARRDRRGQRPRQPGEFSAGASHAGSRTAAGSPRTRSIRSPCRSKRKPSCSSGPTKKPCGSRAFGS